MKNIKLLLSLGAAVLLTACGDPRPPEEIVAERAQARWDALLAQDLETAYSYYSPGFRETTSLSEYRFDMSRRQLRWTGIEPPSAECGDDRCTVTVVVEYEVVAGPASFRGMRSIRGVSETWIRTEGAWWYSDD